MRCPPTHKLPRSCAVLGCVRPPASVLLYAHQFSHKFRTHRQKKSGLTLASVRHFAVVAEIDLLSLELARAKCPSTAFFPPDTPV